MKALVAGGAGGIGRALVRGFCERPDIDAVSASYFRSPPDFEHPKLQWQRCDLSDESAVVELLAAQGPLHYLVNTVGELHSDAGQPEKSLAQIEPEFLLHSFKVNVLPTLLLAKHAGPRFRGSGRAVFATVSARVGSIGDNRLGGWYSYRCSKAALNMALKNISIEWSRSLPQCIVVALHPGTTDTRLSAPFQRNVPSGKLFDPPRTAAYLMAVIDALEPADSGQFRSWDGSLLPW